MPRIFYVSCLIVTALHMVPVARSVAGDFFNGLLRGCAFSVKAAKRPDQGLGLDIDAPRRLESVRHARLYITEFSKKVASLGMKLICKGEDDEWAYFYTVKQAGDLLSIEYTYTDYYGKDPREVPPSEIYGTDLSAEDVINLTVREGHIYGTDIDGERFEIFTGAPLCVEARGIAAMDWAYQDD